MSYLINNILENAIANQIASLLSAFPTINVFVSDASNIKANAPYVLCHASQAEEQITPGSGIFKVPFEVTLFSHTKGDVGTVIPRDAIAQIIQGFAYNNPIAALNGAGLTVYGVVPVSESMDVNTELKGYEYKAEWDIYCTPVGNGIIAGSSLDFSNPANSGNVTVIQL